MNILYVYRGMMPYNNLLVVKAICVMSFLYVGALSFHVNC